MSKPKLIHLAQVCVDLTLSVDYLPERGGDIFATKNGISAGGGYNVLYAARQMEIPATYMGTIGTGPMADIARASLRKIGVTFAGAVLPNVDTGYSVAMTEPSGERTFVSTRGAETMVPETYYQNVELAESDVVYLSGYSLMHPKNAAAIRRFANKYAGWSAGFIVFDTSPVIDAIDSADIACIQSLHPIWSINEREAAILYSRFGLQNEASSTMTSSECGRCQALAAYLHDVVIVRIGAQGAWYCDGRHGATTAPRHIPALSVHAIDTNGAGDAHAGVLCASLLQGESLEHSLILSNCAAALSTTASGPATCPRKDDVINAAYSLAKSFHPHE